MQNVLDVDESLRIHGKRQTDGIVHQTVFLALGQHKGRIYRDGVSGMDTRTLDVLHDTRNQNGLAVADRVNLQLGTHQVFINQDRILNLV